MHARVLTTIALLAVTTFAFISCTSEQPPVTETPGSTPKLTPAPTFTPEPAPTYPPEPTAVAAPTPKPTPAPKFTPAPSYLIEEIPPCTPVEGASVDPCDQIPAPIYSQRSGIIRSEPWSVRSYLDSDRGDGFIIAHVVIRGAYIPGTVRCNFSGRLNGVPAYMGADRQIEYRLYNSIHCYADVRVGAYILGSGPPTLTVLVRTDRLQINLTPEDVAHYRNSDESALIEGGRYGEGDSAGRRDHRKRTHLIPRRVA